MQNAETVLDVLRERGRRACRARSFTGRCSTRNCTCWPTGTSYSNKGAMTPGASGETADGMSEAAVE